MGTEASRSGRRKRATVLGVIAALAFALVATLFQVAAAGPASAADWTVSLRLTKSTDHRIILRADVNRSIAASGLTLGIWDTTTGIRVKACNDGVVLCDVNATTGNPSTSVTTVPTASTTELSSAAHSYAAILSDDDSAYPPAGGVATSAPVTADPWSVSLSSTRLTSKQLQLTAVTNYAIPATGYTLAIYDRTTGARIDACNSGDTPCDGTPTTGYYFTRATFVPKATSSELSSAPHEYVAVLAGINDTLPGENVAATSSVVATDPWAVSLTVTQTPARQIYLTAIANYSIPASGYSLAIFDRTTGVQLKSCSTGEAQCSGSSTAGYYWTRTAPFTPRGSTSEESGVAHEYVAVLAQDVTALPGENVAATSAPVSAAAWSVSLTGGPSTDGKSFSLLAQSSYTLNNSGYTLAVYDRTTGERVGVCGAGYVACSSSGSVSGYFLRLAGLETGSGDTYVAVISDDSEKLPADNVAAESGSVVPVS